MVQLTLEGLQDPKWQELGVDVSVRDRLSELVDRTHTRPSWAHIAPSNVFISQIAAIAQQLGTGIVGFETWDPENVDRIYTPHDNLRLRVVMPPTGGNQLDVIGSVTEALYSDASRTADWQRTLDVMANPSLLVVTVTCTEKGYPIDNELAARDTVKGPAAPQHVMAKVAAMAYHRLLNGGDPIAFASMDNCSQNGRKFQEAVLAVARAWSKNGLLDRGYDLPGYLQGGKVTFPWTMIDRITPRPSQQVIDQLTAMGIEGMEIIETAKHTFASAAVNTEHISYLAIQNAFPNGRPIFEMVDGPGNRVIMVESTDTIDDIERMKVGTCLNPIHTTLASAGFVLAYDTISSMMADPLIKEWVYKQAYDESLPVVVNPGVIDPKVFLREVLEERLPNPNIVDAPARIVTDTSQKIAPRYGGTIRAQEDNARNLTMHALAIAMWCRYLAGAHQQGNDFYGVNDKGQEVRLSDDPLMERLAGYTGKLDPRRGEVTREDVSDALAPILSDTTICDLNLYYVGLGQRIEGMAHEMMQGAGTARKTVKKYVGVN